MDKSMKLYKKALESYNKGDIKRALELCEKSISLNIRNSAAINLKGLLYYFKGELKSAQGLWKLNYDTNKDAVSKKYIESSKLDEEKLSLYNAATLLMKELNINEALKLLEQCQKSDFNYLNVYNALSFCAIKKGELAKAKELTEKVLEKDKANGIAIANLKLLKEYGAFGKKIDLRKTIKIAGYGFLFLGIISILFLGIRNKSIIEERTSSLLNKINATKKNNTYDRIKDPSKIKTTNPVKLNETNKDSGLGEKLSENKVEINKFPKEELKKSLDEKNYEKIYEIYIEFKDKQLGINDKSLLSNSEEVLMKDGVVYFYNTAMGYFAAKDFNKTQTYLTRALNVGEKSYLYPHILYILAVSFENTGDIEDALKYYEVYDTQIQKGEYEETVLYKLAMLYKNLDIAKAKNYAAKLTNAYPQSIYNNSNLRQILSK